MRTRHLAGLALFALSPLVACGSPQQSVQTRTETTPSASASTTGSPTGSPSQAIDGCPVTDTAATGAKVVASADLDGDGTPEDIRLTAPGSSCGSTLLARVGGRSVSVPVPGELPVEAVLALRVGSRSGQLLGVRQVHPRGGYQARVFGFADGRFLELTNNGQPLAPFVATDTAPAEPVRIECTDKGLDVMLAKAQHPTGLMPAWLVTRTSYAVEGNSVTKTGSQVVDAKMSSRQLDRSFAPLGAKEPFGGC